MTPSNPKFTYRCPPHGDFKKIGNEYRCGFCGERDPQVCVVCCRVIGPDGPTCGHAQGAKIP